MNVNVKETITWGIDPCTRKNIFHILPTDLSEQMKHYYIEKTLTRAMNMIENDGWDIEEVLKTILSNRSQFPNKIDRKFSKILLSCLDYSPDKDAFRIHSKGKGIVCVQTIKENDFVTEYLGEIYPAWRWFER